MKKKKIHVALLSLDIYELNSFKKFVQSPYFNANEKIISYFAVLEEQIKSQSDLDELEDKEIWEKVTSGKYDNTKFRKLSSDLYKLFERFLAQKQFDKDGFTPLYMRGKELKKIKEEVLKKDINNEIERTISKQEAISSSKLLEHYLLKREMFGLKVEYEKKTKAFKGDIVESLRIIESDLDKFYLIEKLRIYSTLISWSKLNKLDLNFNKFEKFISRIASDLFENVPGIKIYNNIYHLLTNPEAFDKYLELKSFIKEYKYHFDTEELKDIYESAFSYGLGRLNQGDETVLNEVFDLYSEALKDDVLLSDGELSPTTFRNIVGIALRAGNYEWTSNFIFEYSKYLNESYRENAVLFNTARLKFYQKDFWGAISFLQQVNYDDVFYNLNSRTLLLAAYFELDEFEVLESQLASFKIFLRRESNLTKDRKKAYLDLLKYLGKLINIDSGDKVKIQSIRDTVIETKGIVNKQWLLEKIDAILA
jgi:hypothetical protein